MSAFQGRIGRTVYESNPHWPDLPRPRKGAPNVVVVLFDDLGFAHLGCYGSSIATPNIDKLAAKGLRFSNFHTTALCSPTRAALHDRLQSPFGRHARACQLEYRLSELHRHRVQECSDHRRGLAADAATRPSPSASGT